MSESFLGRKRDRRMYESYAMDYRYNKEGTLKRVPSLVKNLRGWNNYL